MQARRLSVRADDVGRRLDVGRHSMKPMHATCLAVPNDSENQFRVIVWKILELSQGNLLEIEVNWGEVFDILKYRV